MKLLKIVELSVSLNKKVNLGNYQTKDIFCSIKAELEINEDVQERARFLYEECQHQLNEQEKIALENSGKIVNLKKLFGEKDV